MKLKSILVVVGSLALASGQTGTEAVITNSATAKWTHDKGDPPGSESVFLREDTQTHGLELLVRFPAGHVITPHWHDCNERIIVLEGKLNLRNGDAKESSSLTTGGFAFLPAREVQRLTCSSETRCTFYLAWDGPPKSHAAR